MVTITESEVAAGNCKQYSKRGISLILDRQRFLNEAGLLSLVDCI